MDRLTQPEMLTGRDLLDDLVAAPFAIRTLELFALREPEGIEQPELLTGQIPFAARIGAALRDAADAHDGRAYAVSPSVIAVLIAGTSPSGIAASLARDELDGVGAGSRAGVVHARVVVPTDARPNREAVALGFDRLRAQARAHPLSPGRQVRDVLLALLREHSAPGDRVQRPDVAGDAVAIGRRLGMETRELDELVRAAELQDVGMLALESEVLGKPTLLDERDWQAIRHHPGAAERVLAAAPALRPVARIVRSCYERWDGTGYPDGLAGEEIPLSARIVAVCVAYHAMREPRPHRPPLSEDAAVAELVRCSGAQFDPQIVAEFLSLVAHRNGERREDARRRLARRAPWVVGGPSVADARTPSRDDFNIRSTLA